TRSYGDWSSDVCSSDLTCRTVAGWRSDILERGVRLPSRRPGCYPSRVIDGRTTIERSCSEERVPLAREQKQEIMTGYATKEGDKIGRASCRERSEIWDV